MHQGAANCNVAPISMGNAASSPVEISLTLSAKAKAVRYVSPSPTIKLNAPASTMLERRSLLRVALALRRDMVLNRGLVWGGFETKMQVYGKFVSESPAVAYGLRSKLVLTLRSRKP